MTTIKGLLVKTKTLLFHENYYSLAPWLPFHSTFWAFLFSKINLDLITTSYWSLFLKLITIDSCINDVYRQNHAMWNEAICFSDMVVVLAIEKLQLRNRKISRSNFFFLVTFRKSISTELNISKNVIANRLEFNIGGKFRKKLWCCRRQWEYYALTKGQCSKRQRLYRDQFTSSTKLNQIQITGRHLHTILS